MTLSDKISTCRRQLGLSQEALAAQLNVSRQAVSKWETGDAEPESGKLVALAQTFGVTVDWLLSGEDALPEPAAAVPVATPPSENTSPVRRSPFSNLRPGYLIYLILLSLFVLTVTTSQIHFSPSFQFKIYFHNLCNFYDPALLLAMLAGALLLLFGSGLRRPAGHAFRFMFSKAAYTNCSKEQAARSRRAIRTACAGWVLGGLLLSVSFIVQELAALRFPYVSGIGSMSSIVLCLLFYIVIGLFLVLPIDLSLKNRLG